MKLIQLPVLHQQFGSGVIISQTDTTVEVQFPQPHGIRRFLYPAAFLDHLQLQDAALQQDLLDEVQRLKAEREALRLAREQIILRQIEEKQQAISASKKTVTRKRIKKATEEE